MPSSTHKLIRNRPKRKQRIDDEEEAEEEAEEDYDDEKEKVVPNPVRQEQKRPTPVAQEPREKNKADRIDENNDSATNNDGSKQECFVLIEEDESEDQSQKKKEEGEDFDLQESNEALLNGNILDKNRTRSEIQKRKEDADEDDDEILLDLESPSINEEKAEPKKPATVPFEQLAPASPEQKKQQAQTEPGKRRLPGPSRFALNFLRDLTPEENMGSIGFKDLFQPPSKDEKIKQIAVVASRIDAGLVCFALISLSLCAWN